MTLNGEMALILHYFTEFVYDVVVKQLLVLPGFQNILLIVYDQAPHAYSTLRPPYTARTYTAHTYHFPSSPWAGALDRHKRSQRWGPE